MPIQSIRGVVEAAIQRASSATGVDFGFLMGTAKRESGYNPRASHRGNLGLMQIRYGTARAMGYTGSASGLLDANTNLAYAVPYLANAYKVAGGNQDRAVSLYSGGYYYAAKRKGLLRELRTGPGDPVTTGSVSTPSPSLASLFSSVFTPSGTH